jgi:pimeloyl-ACP methyl ester carboxylesterase
MSLPGRLHMVDGVRIFVHRSGPAGAPAASPVVLVHGWMVSHWGWRKVVPALTAAGHDVIALDLPGFGESDRPPPRAFRYDAVGLSDAVLGLLDVLEVPRATLVGASLGGAVSLVAAARHPDRVDGLVLVDPLVYATRMPLEAALVRVPGAGRLLFQAAATRSMIRYVMRRDIYQDASLANDDWVDYVWERVNRPGGIEAAHAAMQLAADPGQVERSTRAVRAPTLIVWGENDRLFPAHLAHRLQGEILGSEVRIIPDCGHAPGEERPEELARVLAPFLAARAGR